MARSRRWVLDGARSAAAVLVSVGLVAGCGSAEGAGGPGADRTVEIIVPNFPQLITGVEATLDERFESASGIDVEIVNVGGDSSYTGVNQRVQNDLIAGNEPDLAIIGLNNVRAYADSESVVALDELMRGDDAFDPADLAPNLLALTQQRGTTYGMPYGVSTYTLYYNKDVFRAAGLDPNRAPATFSELREAARVIVERGAARNGVVIRADHAGGYGFQNFLASAGGSFMDPAEQEVTFNSPAGVSVVSFWRDLAAAGIGQAVTNEQAGDLFTRGDAGMVFQSSSYSATLASQVKFEVGSAAFPIPDGGSRKAVVGGTAIVAFDADPQKLADSWTVITALVGAEGITNLVEASGFAPINTVATAPEHLGDYLAANPLAAASWEQMDHLAPWYQFPGSRNNEISRVMQDRINAAIAGREDPAAALDAAARATADLLR